ncbi:MAG: Fic family protein [Erysipelotrichales bacterium]|nr:Fic family protein [Erysipelotrichales bacterium]
MNYLTSKDISMKWKLAERSVRDYCAKGRVPGALLDGKTWLIPENAIKPNRQIRHTKKQYTLLEVLKMEKESQLKGGIYHKLQIEMTYNSNHIEGSELTHDQTRYIFETRTINVENKSINVDDIIETANHFRCIDLTIDSAKSKLTEALIKQFHYILKNGTSDSMKSWFRVGDYKMLPNEVGGCETTSPNNVKNEMKRLLNTYNSKNNITIVDIIEFHKQFETIHPFQDGNGRVGRLIMLKECLKHNIVPILITDEYKQFYYRGLKEWDNEKGYLIDTCLYGQDIMKTFLDYFNIKHE